MLELGDTWRTLLCAVLAAGAVAQLANMPSPRVQVADGKLRGKYVLTRESRKVRAFLGIPYAKPPVEELRFKSPEPPLPWDGERWAVDHPKPCVQPERRHGEPIGREDCLYLNVYTPDGIDKREAPHPFTDMGGITTDTIENSIPDGNLTSNEVPGSNATVDGTVANGTEVNVAAANATALNTTAYGTKEAEKTPKTCPLLPVMVFFHGGSFEMGSSEPFTHEYLLDRDVIVVTVQYRLGLLGFMSTGDDVLPGNMGFKDQRLALQWVQKNIEHFGGCPEKVTIVGDGAGGASVHFHMLYSQSKNPLFRAGISMSGTALSPWAFHSPAEVAHMVDRVATLSDCDTDSSRLVECLLEKPAGVFVQLLHQYKEEMRGSCGDWGLAFPVLGGVLENSTTVDDAFITSSPWDKKVSLPWMVGATSKEMLYEFTPQLVDRRDRMFKKLEQCFNDSLPQVMGYEYSVANHTQLAEGVRGFYFKDEPISRELFADIIDAVSDGSVLYPTFESVRRAGRRSTWLYHFNFIGTNTYGATALDGRIAPGRGDDLFFFFPRPLGKNVPRRNKDPDTAMSRKMVKIWTNFATHLDPTPTKDIEKDDLKWPPIHPSTSFLNIGQETMKVERPFHAYRMNFWSLQDFPHRDDEYGDSTKRITQGEGGFHPTVKET